MDQPTNTNTYLLYDLNGPITRSKIKALKEALNRCFVTILLHPYIYIYITHTHTHTNTQISDDEYCPSCAEAIKACKVTKQSKIQELSFSRFQLSLNSFPTNR